MGADVSTIIVNYNAGRLLNDCVNSLLACPLDIQIIIVDNASTDESLKCLEGLDQVTIVQNKTNLGFSAGCNVGFNFASEDRILFLNPDCYCSTGAIKILLDCLNFDHQVGMVGGLLVDPDGTEQRGGRRAIPTPWRTLVKIFGLTRFSNRWPRLFLDFNLHKQPLPEGPIEVEAISGACMLVKREALEDVGLWDEGYFLHCEDLDYCMRFRQNGWKIAFVPEAIFVHEQGGCSQNRRAFVEWHKHKGMIRFYRKFFQHQYPGVLMWLVKLNVWIRFSAVVLVITVRRFLRWFRFE